MLRILIADDHKMMIDGWSAVLDKEESFNIVGTASSGEEIMDFLSKNQVDILITDIDMGSADDGLQVIKKIRNKYGSSVKILTVSMHDEIGFIQDAIESGTDGYILKSNSTETMLEALHKIGRGETYYSQDVVNRIARKMRSTGILKSLNLTKREKKILPLICEGLSAKEVAEKMFISHHTVNTFKKQLFAKFEVKKTTELINKARETGFIK